MDKLQDYFWYQLCLRIQSLRDYNTSSVNNTARTYDLNPVYYKRIDFDKVRAYIALHDVVEENLVYITRYDYNSRVEQAVQRAESQDEVTENLERLADDVLGEFIWKYKDKII